MEIPSSDSRADTCGRAGKTELIDAFRDSANAPRKQLQFYLPFCMDVNTKALDNKHAHKELRFQKLILSETQKSSRQ
jgi:hypothetical protein